MRLYFMGICGTAMGNVAVMMRSLGHEVYGSDTGVYPPMSDVLRAAGIEIFEGYDPQRLERLAPDFVVVGNAISRGNPEVEWLLETRALRYGSLPQVLHEQVLSSRQNIVVSGTHGKTTTTTFCACLLKTQGKDPGYLIGGVPRDLPGGAHPGSEADPFVIEGDEYDSAFFDKRSKFIHYLPSVALVNNIEFDHADIFRDLVDVKRTFSHFLRLVPRNGFVVANADDDNVEDVVSRVSWAKVIRVGLGARADVRIADFCENDCGATFSLYWQNALWGHIQWTHPGIFNARNAAMAATAAGLALFPNNPTALDLSALSAIKGVRRRQEILFRDERTVVIEDFGHHPTAIAETLTSLRARFAQHKIIACFEPRSNTARTRVFQEALPKALGLADMAFMGPVHRAEKLPDDQRLDLPAVAAQISASGKQAFACASNTAVLEGAWKALSEGQSPQLCVFFSNGAFDGIIAQMASRAKAASH